jgi:hypothetical protein
MGKGLDDISRVAIGIDDISRVAIGIDRRRLTLRARVGKK